MNSSATQVRSRSSRLLHWFSQLVWYGITVIIILVAIAISLIRAFLPDIKSYHDEIEAMATAALGQAVTIESLDARMDGLTPTFIFNGVHLLDTQHKRELIEFGQVRMGFDLLQSIRYRRLAPKSLTISGVDIGVRRQKNGVLTVQGIDIDTLEQTFGKTVDTNNVDQDELAQWFFERSQLAIENSTVLWRDDLYGGKTVRFDNVNFKLRNDDAHHQLAGTLRLPEAMGRELEAAFDFTGNILVPTDWQGEFYVRGDALHAKGWDIKPRYKDVVLQDAALDFQIWGQWGDRRFTSISGEVAAHDIKVHWADKKRTAGLKQLSGVFDWQQHATGWHLRSREFRMSLPNTDIPAAQFGMDYDESAQPQWTFHGSRLQIQEIVQFFLESNLLDKDTSNIIKELQPQGEIHETFVRYSKDADRPVFSVQASFDRLAIQPYQYYPGIQAMRGEVYLDQMHGQLRLDSNNAEINFPKLFREPFKLGRLQTEIGWQHDKDGFFVQVPSFDIQSAFVSTQGSLSLSQVGHESPFINLQSRFYNGDVAAAWRFYPVGIMHKELVQWLDKGIVSGRVTNGTVLLRGRLEDFPYAQQQGVFITDYDTQDVVLNYQQGWPHLTGLNVHGHFSGQSMQLQATQGKLFDGQLSEIDVTIEDLINPVLHAQGKFNGDTRDTVRFLVESTIAPEARGFYRNSKFGGTSQADFKLQLPLDARMAVTHPLDYRGKVTFKESTLNSWDGLVEVAQLNGQLHYSTEGVMADQLTATVHGGPAKLQLFTHKSGQSQQIKLAMAGELEPGRILKRTTVPVAQRIQGKTRWQGLLSFGYTMNGKSIPGSFAFGSDLRGVEVSLPSPLTKSAADSRFLNFTIEFPHDDSLLIETALENTLRSKIQLDTSSSRQTRLLKATVNFSNQEPLLPEKPLIKIGGTLEGVALHEWGNVFPSVESGNKQTSALAQLNVPIELHMDRLVMQTAQDKPEQPAGTPDDVPVINGTVQDLKVNDMRLGRFDIAMHRENAGIRIDRLNFSSPDMNIKGTGSWLYRKHRHLTNMVIEIDATDLDNMLQRLGYSGIIRNGQANVRAQLSWEDSPNRFEPAKLNGSLGVIINNGTITQIDPGAGRLLGLLSLVELPKRLTLNFKDIGKGLSFNQIKGSFEIKEGQAMTEDLNIDSSIAVVAIRGRTGFATRDYDLEVIAVPRASDSLPIIAYLLSGGQAAGWAWVFDKLFGNKVDDSMANRYKVTGSWENPVVKTIDEPQKAVSNPPASTE